MKLSPLTLVTFLANKIYPAPQPWLAALVMVSILTPLSSTKAQTADQDSTNLEFFEKKVRPILVENCYSCHAADTKPSGGLRVDDRNGLLLGGDAGPAVIAGDPAKSLLLQRIQHPDVKRRMPKESDALSPDQIDILATWIRNGVAWPRERIPASLGRIDPEQEEIKAKHWAWQPLANPSVPAVANEAWPKSTVDHFLLAKLEAGGLAPLADADRTTLIRRVTFDLTGLPPSPEAIAQFEQDTSPNAFEVVVDRLLASPGFGEQWGRHWLDVARYGESTGPSRNIPYPHAWKYRDYVIDAIQRDVPQDRFIQEQIAGDLLPANSNEERDRLATATGFLALGVKDVNQRFKTRFLMDNVDEQIDVVSRSVIGLTVSCARCHDHKFDPIPTTNYYALAGIFASTDDCAGVRSKMGGAGLDYYDPKMLVNLSSDLPPVPEEQVSKLTAEVAEAKKAWDAIRGTPEGLKLAADGKPTQRPFRLKFEKLQGELASLHDPAARGHAVHGVREGSAIADTEVRIRGEAERLGPTVPRGFLTTFGVADIPKIEPNQSGRLQLAQWLTSSKNPLTARVQVNRAWEHLFGRGLVSTVDNFGIKGDVPSHPELLDFLATQFINDGWSLKKLVRSLVLTRAYQLSSGGSDAHRQIDPDNHLVWRHSPRRLTAEEMRDTILASTGVLKERPAEGSAARELKMIEMRDNGPEAQLVHKEADTALYRSIYLPLLRGVTPASLEAFDPVSQSLVTGQREATTVPTQALFLLNATFVRERALSFAEQVAKGNDRFDAEWVRKLYLATLGRLPSDQEVGRAGEFLADYASSYREASPVSVETPALADARNAEETGTAAAPPVNPDDIDRSDALGPINIIQAKDPKSAAWMSLIQALYASAEFRFVR